MVSQAPVCTCVHVFGGGELSLFRVNITKVFLYTFTQVYVTNTKCDECGWRNMKWIIFIYFATRRHGDTFNSHSDTANWTNGSYSTLRSSRRENNKKITLPLMAAILFRAISFLKINLNDLRRKWNSCDFMSFIFIFQLNMIQ